jgi:hypothetical protein
VTAALDAEEQVEEEVAPVELVRDDAVSGADQVLGNDPAHGAESGDEHDEDHGDDDVAAETLLPDELPSDAEPVAAEEPDADGDASPSVESSETGGAARSGEQDAAAEDPAGDPADPAAMIEAVPSGNAGAGVAAATDDPAGSADGGYDHLFGSTVVRSVEGAAVRDGDAADESGEQPPTKDHGDPTDHDGLTVTVAELRRIRAAGNADARSPSVRVAPSVDGEHLARQCSGGHLNPPSATACRICGLAVEGEPFRTDRIELGSIRFSTGRIVPLSGTILIGRSPKPPLVAPGDSRRAVELVEVPSPQQDISRNHVELRVDGWQVLVTDLGSTNGTVITIPGRDPQRLRSNESFPLPAGATVNLADEVQFAYEVGP